MPASRVRAACNRSTSRRCSKETLDFGVPSGEIPLNWHAGARMIRGEATRLRQVVHNLMQNAVDACVDRTDGQVTVDAAERETAGSPRRTRTGADSATMAGILRYREVAGFEPLRHPKPKGTGLGLAIVKKSSMNTRVGSPRQSLGQGGAVVTVVFPLLVEEKTET